MAVDNEDGFWTALLVVYLIFALAWFVQHGRQLAADVMARFQ